MYYFECNCVRCVREKDQWTEALLYTITESGQKLEDLNTDSLALEKEGKFT